jgi:hypoxanthine-guanine phosphoribosyltransferase
MPDTDPHDEIERLEAQIEDLTARIESCRKFILAGRIAVIGGGVLFVALLLDVIHFDLQLMMLAMASLLGGIVVWGSNSSTEKEAAAERATAEASRKALIGMMELRVVAERPILH